MALCYLHVKLCDGLNNRVFAERIVQGLYRDWKMHFACLDIMSSVDVHRSPLLCSLVHLRQFLEVIIFR